MYSLRKFSLFFILLFAAKLVSAQDFDVSSALADPMTFVFNDGKHTVNGYIYSVLEKKTKCCGNDAIYLSVKISDKGLVEEVKSLTGKNDCYKKSIGEIVKTIRWKVSKARTVYWEVKPIAECKGSGSDNVYAALNLDGNSNGSNETVVTNDNTDDSDNNMESNNENNDNSDNNDNETLADNNDDSDQNDDSQNNNNDDDNDSVVTNDNQDTFDFSQNNKKDNIEKTTTTVKDDENIVVNNNTSGVAGNNEYQTPKYKSTGNHNPDESHADSHIDVQGPMLGTPTYVGGANSMAIFVKQGLRKQGVCGMVHALAELTIDKTGSVLSYRIFKANTEKVMSALPSILQQMKFNPLQFKQNTYLEFKTIVYCKDEDHKLDIDGEAPYLKTDDGKLYSTSK